MDSDEALFARLAGGDLSAFDRLYERYEKPLFGFLVRWLGERAEAEDVLHQSFLALLDGPKPDFHQGSFRAWIHQVARNLCLNRARSRDRGARAKDEVRRMADATAPDAEHALTEGGIALALDGAVEKLPPPLAEVVRLRAAGLSYEEVSAAVDAPLGTVKSRMHEAVKRLRQEMKPWR